jgi:hypothetical protein
MFKKQERNNVNVASPLELIIKPTEDPLAIYNMKLSTKRKDFSLFNEYVQNAN